MNWKKWLGGDNWERDSQDYSLSIEAVPGTLWVRVHLHDLTERGEKFPCWTFMSEGFELRKLPEVALTVRRIAQEPLESLADEVVAFFKTIYALSKQGQAPRLGGVLKLSGETTVLGRKGVAFAPCWGLGDLVATDEALSATLLTEAEVRLARGLGSARIFARLALSHHTFPWPPWSDRSRQSVADEVEHSVLDGITMTTIPRVEVLRQGSAVLIRINETSREAFERFLLPLDEHEPFGAAAVIPAAAQGCLVWQAGQRGSRAIFPEEEPPREIHGAYFAVTRGEDTDRVGLVEDGYVARLGAESWAGLRLALIRGQPWSCSSQGTDTEQLTLEWRPEPQIEEPASDRAVL